MCLTPSSGNAQATKLNWATQIGNFPAACNSTSVVTQVGATLTCRTIWYQTVKSGGTAQTQEPALNLIAGSNMTVSCVDNAGVSTDCTLTSSSTGSTAWSAITAATNSNAGTFAMSGNTLDLTAATLVKLRVAGGLTSSVNGDLGYDSTAAVWHIWQGAADRRLIAATNLGTSGQPCMSNADGSCTFADPIVSQATASNLNAQVVGNIASGSADSGNPVKIGGVFNTTQPTVTTGQRVDQQMTARGELLIAKGVSGFSIDNTAFTANIGTTNGLALDSSVNGILLAQGSTTSGQKGHLTQAAVTTSAPSYTNGQTSPLSLNTSGGLRVDGSGVTQPVSGTVTANAGTGTFNIQANASVNLAQIAGTATVADPCQVNPKTYDSFSGTANTQLITGTASKKIYFCSFAIVVGAATNVAIVEGTGTVCATSIAKFPGLSGGTTAATGWNFAANGGSTQGNGTGAIAGEGTAADNVCVLLSAANQTNISYSYVVQ